MLTGDFNGPSIVYNTVVTLESTVDDVLTVQVLHRLGYVSAERKPTTKGKILRNKVVEDFPFRNPNEDCD